MFSYDVTVIFLIALVIVFVAILSISVRGKRTRCPKCDRNWAGKITNKEIVDRGSSKGRIISRQGRMSVPVSMQGSYTVYNYHLRCKYCGWEWTKEKVE